MTIHNDTTHYWPFIYEENPSVTGEFPPHMRGVDIGIDTNIDVIVVSSKTWEAHHSPRAKPEGCGMLPRSLMGQQLPKLRYKSIFYHDETKLMMNKQIMSI